MTLIFKPPNFSYLCTTAEMRQQPVGTATQRSLWLSERCCCCCSEEQARRTKAVCLPVGAGARAGAGAGAAGRRSPTAGPCRRLTRRAALPWTAVTLPRRRSSDWVLPATDYKCRCRFCDPCHLEEKSLMPTPKPTSRV